MSNKKYVPQGVYLACDKGTVPTEFKITNNNNSFLFDEPIANTGDMVPNLNIMPFGACSVKNGNPCMPVPTPWQGFEDGIFIGNFNPLLEDSVMQCGIGGKIEIHYSLEEAQAACGGGMSFWEIVGAAVLVVAAVALIVISGGAIIAAVGVITAVGASTTARVVSSVVIAAELVGIGFGIKGLYDYSQDGDEEKLFKDVALGYLFLGIGAGIAKGFKAWKATKVGDEVIELLDDGVKAGDEIVDDAVKGVDELVEGSFKSGDEIAGKVIKQVKNGDNGKVAVIGRKMDGHVNVVAETLESQGKNIEVFNDVYQAGKTFEIDGIVRTWQDLVDDFGDLSKYTRNEKGWIVDSDLLNTLMYKANKQWAQKLIDEGFEIIDIGYPPGLDTQSLFYNMELGTIF